MTLRTLDGGELTEALTSTARHRGIPLRTLTSSITDIGERRQSSYTAWLRRQGIAASGYPDLFTHVIALVTAFADPLLTGEAVTPNWDPKSGMWS
ncbi:hypothetical protein [Streptosporangium sp. V21-05]|uniref:hypothetical protein n=1 Tax=Streptosporangium sp. V21-05 TaxID=3446115 RepID=UPI003F52CFC1